ncbi:hypothetical protein C0995_010088 [Termitomyces sp. Mi166|nr:hypothetical protein C0995_010088 [Termitomyces sp. Mi166\
MANHGYIARDGKNLSSWDLVASLKACYNLSTPLAFFLSIGGFLLLRRIRNVDLHEFGRYGRIEHDASLVDKDAPKGQEYAPIEIEPELVDLLLVDAKTGKEGGEGPEFDEKCTLMNATDVARARVRREKECPKLDGLHAEIARGEMGIILGVWETRAGKNVGYPRGIDTRMDSLRAVTRRVEVYLCAGAFRCGLSCQGDMYCNGTIQGNRSQELKLETGVNFSLSAWYAFVEDIK